MQHNLMFQQNDSEPEWQHSKECMRFLQNIAMCDQEKREYQERVTTGQKIDRQTPDRVIPVCCYPLQGTQKQSTFTIIYMFL